MIKIVEELKKWREDRNMQDDVFVIEEQVAFILDKCKEVLLAKTNEHKAEEYCNIAIFAFNGLGLLNKEFFTRESALRKNISGILIELYYILNKDIAFVDIELSWIILSCKFSVEDLGYSFQKMMLEKIKVLNSRIQSPTQARDWAENGASGKWEKSTFAEHMAMVYKPDFESCRITR